MGIYVNPGNYEYQRALNEDIYIDKTALIAKTNQKVGKFSRFMCVSRPRRFGKSMAAEMLISYYSKGCDSRKMFAGKAIEADPSFEEHLNQHNVIRIDVQRFIYGKESLYSFTDVIQRTVIEDLESEFSACDSIRFDRPLPLVLEKIYAKTGQGFIFIIDEWDSVFRMAQDMPDVQKTYLDFMRNLFKGAVYVELVYMTGILPIKKYGQHSALNMFAEYSMTDPDDLSDFFGFTEEEVRSECTLRDVDFNEMQKWYDGYLLSGKHIYNPKSVIDALTRNRFQSYWTGTETYEALKVYIDRDFDGLKEAVVEMLGGGSCGIDPTTFQNDMTTFDSKDDILTLLVHLGYLTYDREAGEVSIPNLEIRQEFVRAVKTGTAWGNLMQSLNRSLDLLESTWNLDGEAVAAGLEAIHEENTSWLTYHDENSLACVIYIAYYSASAYYLNPVKEFPSGKGLADIVYLPRQGVKRPALVAELKWDQSAEGAIAQIRNRNYAKRIEDYTGEILLVGINYDKTSKKHQCIIEKHIKK